MQNKDSTFATRLFGGSFSYMRQFLFRILSVGPIPGHIAFIMDGNRRYAKKLKLADETGYRAGFLSVMSMLKYCYELGVKYVTIYAFSIDNFKRRPEEVQAVMDLMLEKIEDLLEEESIVNKFGIRMHFAGNLKLLNEPVRVAAEKAMKATINNSNSILIICVAYTSTDEIVRAVQEASQEKSDQIKASGASKAQNGEISEEKQEAVGQIKGLCASNAQNSEINEQKPEKRDQIKAPGASKARNGEIIEEKTETVEQIKALGVSKAQNGEIIEEKQEKGDQIKACIANKAQNSEIREEKQEVNRIIKLTDIERHMYMALAPDPDILVRTSSETRLSNFLLWQTSNCLLYSPKALWPEIGLRHLLWAILNFQRIHSYLEKRKKQL